VEKYGRASQAAGDNVMRRIMCDLNAGYAVTEASIQTHTNCI